MILSVKLSIHQVNSPKEDIQVIKINFRKDQIHFMKIPELLTEETTNNLKTQECTMNGLILSLKEVKKN